MKTSKNKTVYLHIGRHKTGTTSIQNFIAANPESLSEHALFYPQTGRQGIAHHRLANALSFQATKTDEQKQAAVESDLIHKLRTEIDSQPHSALISSEGLQNSNPDLVSQVFANYNVRTLVYIRNQTDYLASSYAQKIWATSYSDSMEIFYKRIFNGDYASFLATWEIISDDGINIRKFDRNSLNHADIVADFFEEMLGIEDRPLIEKILARDTFDSNPSLTSELLAYKRAYNTHDFDHDDATEKRFRRALAHLSLEKASPPVRVTADLAISCAGSYNQSNRAVSEKYFDGNELFDMDRPTADAAILDRAMSNRISQDIVAFDPRLEPLIEKFMSVTFPNDKAA